ncbi:hypothetical protein [Candidatus Poriferisodalis sp.]|uniref:hypothetical protein n=1 Tax=Candidatus Poriferisodalis sp. TaxID=3101277 RepID=UPI003B01A30D
MIAVSKSGKRVVVPTLEILDPADELDWSLAQQEAYDRGLEALRRQGHESARHFKTIEELQSERLDLERDQRRVEAEAEADEMIAKAEAKFAAMDDWREVRAANERIANKWREVEQALEDMQVETEVGGYFDGCFEYDAAQALKRRWSATSRLGQDRANQIYSETVQSFKDSRVGQALARHLMTLDPEDRVAAYNSHEEQRAQTLRPVDRAKAEIAREAIDDLDVELAYGGSDRGFIAKLR